MTNAMETLRHLLTLPPIPKDRIYSAGDCFDPWEAFPCLYGSYSSEFDDVAILVLENIRDKKFGQSAGESIAHEMFREILCTSGLCDYGASPRGCFPDWDSKFADILPALIEKWKEYRAVMWEDD
ncbi:MAG: hypothetical protein AAFY03_00060 [Pseudomonadota bacterium]